MVGFLSSSLLLHIVANKNAISFSRKCQLCCYYWLTIMKAQLNRLCICVLNKYISLFQESKTTLQQNPLGCFTYFCCHRFCTATPSTTGKFADENQLTVIYLAFCFLRCFKSIHTIHLTAVQNHSYCRLQLNTTVAPVYVKRL